MKSTRLLPRILLGLAVALTLGFIALLLVPRGEAKAFPAEGWTALRDDELARAHLPGLPHLPAPRPRAKAMGAQGG